MSDNGELNGDAMEMQGENWVGEVDLKPEDKFVCITFYDRENYELIDNNEKLGYLAYVHQTDGKLSPEAYAIKANMYSSYYRLIGIDRAWPS